MSRLVVLMFKEESGAEQMRQALGRLRKQHLIPFAEPAVVVRRQDGKVKVKPTVGLAGPAALMVAFWGVMVGLLFSAPWLGLGIGAVAGAIIGALADIGVDDPFIREAGRSLEPGGSALLLFVHDWADDQALEKEVSRFDGIVLPSPPVAKDQSRLRPALGEKE